LLAGHWSHRRESNPVLLITGQARCH